MNRTTARFWRVFFAPIVGWYTSLTKLRSFQKYSESFRVGGISQSPSCRRSANELRSGVRGRTTHPQGGAARFSETPDSLPPRRTDAEVGRMERGTGAAQLARLRLRVLGSCGHIPAHLFQWTGDERRVFRGHPLPPFQVGNGRSRAGKFSPDRIRSVGRGIGQSVPLA
jgi:hypothetical protein